MKKLLLTTVIALVTLAQANATWFMYDAGNGQGWKVYANWPDGDDDATQYYPNISACAKAYKQWVVNHNLP